MAILLEKLANDEEEEVDPSVKNAAANQSKVTPLFFAESVLTLQSHNLFC